MTQQHRRHSLLEAFLNVFIGFGVSVVANIFILPLYGMPYSIRNSIDIGFIFTGISIVRSYWVRRFFVYLHDRRIL